MHDELLERQLRTALREDARELAFTITAAELERRAILRGRAGSRRLAVLLAAAVAIGALGGAGLLAGLTQPRPSPTAPVAVDASQPARSPSVPRTLPALDDLVAVDPRSVLIAQAHGPADRPYELGFESSFPTGLTVDLGTVFGGDNYDISVACLGTSDEASMMLDVRTPGDRETPGPTGPEIRCDGTLVDHAARTGTSATLSLYLEQPASWRIVVRGSRGILPLPLPTENPVLPPAAGNLEELVRSDDQAIEAGDSWGGGQMLIDEVDGVAARWAYEPLLWCASGTMRLVFGDLIDGVLVPVTETHVACNGMTHDLYLGIPALASRVYVAGTPGTRWSLRIAAEKPPIELPGAEPGWRVSAGFGPHLSFDAARHRVLAPIEGGRVRIAIACAGFESIAVTVDLGMVEGERRDRFIARCHPDGAVTSATFEFEGPSAHIELAEPVGTWTAISFLVPEPSTAP